MIDSSQPLPDNATNITDGPTRQWPPRIALRRIALLSIITGVMALAFFAFFTKRLPEAFGPNKYCEFGACKILLTKDDFAASLLRSDKGGKQASDTTFKPSQGVAAVLAATGLAQSPIASLSPEDRARLDAQIPLRDQYLAEADHFLNVQVPILRTKFNQFPDPKPLLARLDPLETEAKALQTFLRTLELPVSDAVGAEFLSRRDAVAREYGLLLEVATLVAEQVNALRDAEVKIFISDKDFQQYPFVSFQTSRTDTGVSVTITPVGDTPYRNEVALCSEKDNVCAPAVTFSCATPSTHAGYCKGSQSIPLDTQQTKVQEPHFLKLAIKKEGGTPGAGAVALAFADDVVMTSGVVEGGTTYQSGRQIPTPSFLDVALPTAESDRATLSVSISLALQQNAYELDEYLAGTGSVVNPNAAPVAATFKLELFRGTNMFKTVTLEFPCDQSRKKTPSCIPPGTTPINPGDVLFALSNLDRIPANPDLVGPWKIAVVSLKDSRTVQRIELPFQVIMPRPVRITVDAAAVGKDIRTLKRGIVLKRSHWGALGDKNSAAPFNTASMLRWLLEKYDRDIGVKGNIVRLQEDWYDLLTEDPLVINEIKRLGGEPLILFNDIPKKLGDGTPDYALKPPKSWKAWRTYVAQVVARYKQLGVTKYEIWNEADLCGNWLGTKAQYYQLHETTVRGILDGDPHAIIWGPAAFELGGSLCGSDGKESGYFLFNLIDFSASKGLPLHVISIHEYDQNPDTPTKVAIDVLRSKLLEKGYARTKIAFDEWDFNAVDRSDIRNANEVSASYMVAQFGQFALAGVTYQTEYDMIEGNEWFNHVPPTFFTAMGAFTPEGVTKAKYNALKIISSMGDKLISATLNGTETNRVIATKSDDKVTITIANYSNQKVSDIKLNIQNIAPEFRNYTKYIIDATHSNAYAIRDRISATIQQAGNAAVAPAASAFTAFLQQRAYSEKFVQKALTMIIKWLANQNDADVATWVVSLTTQQINDVLGALNAAGDAYQNVLMPAVDEVNNLPEVKLYSESKTVQIASNHTYSETLTLEPYAIVMIMLSSDALPTKTLFLSSQTYTGNLGGLAGADAKCQTLATSAGLSGTFKSWLSDSVTNARDRLTHATVPYKLVNGTTIANNWSDLIDGQLSNPITHDEKGNQIASPTLTKQVWTGTRHDGTKDTNRIGSQYYCSDWSSPRASVWGIFGYAGATRTTATNVGSAWSAASLISCGQSLYLYCMEQ